MKVTIFPREVPEPLFFPKIDEAIPFNHVEGRSVTWDKDRRVLHYNRDAIWAVLLEPDDKAEVV